VDGTEDGALRREIHDEPLELPASLKAIETLTGRRRRRRRRRETDRRGFIIHAIVTRE